MQTVQSYLYKSRDQQEVEPSKCIAPQDSLDLELVCKYFDLLEC